MAHGFADKEIWEHLIKTVKNEKYTNLLPIIGPGVVDYIFGTREEIARDWFEEQNLSIQLHELDSLPQVLQYLAILESRDITLSNLNFHLCEKLKRKHPDICADLQPEEQCDERKLDELISEVGSIRQGKDDYEPHKVLAGLNLPMYITANFSSILFNTIKAKYENARVEVCHWRSNKTHKTVFNSEPDNQPQRDRPLVYHILGHFTERDTLVLTEDDYFDYLIAVKKEKNFIPENIQASLINSHLLFLGFDVRSWDFRILFRLISYLNGNQKLNDYSHVAVQIDPNADTRGKGFKNPERVRKYLKKYLIPTLPDCNIYWGKVNEFVTELQDRIQDTKSAVVKVGNSREPLNLFSSYAHTDEEYRIEIGKQLAPLVKNGKIDLSHDRRISAGDDWQHKIHKYIHEADIFLLLLSADFLDSDYIRNTEVVEMWKMYKAGKARLIPVIVRDCMWKDEKIFSDLQALPQDGKAIESFDKKDTAYKLVAEGIKKVVMEFSR